MCMCSSKAMQYYNSKQVKTSSLSLDYLVGILQIFARYIFIFLVCVCAFKFLTIGCISIGTNDRIWRAGIHINATVTVKFLFEFGSTVCNQKISVDELAFANLHVMCVCLCIMFIYIVAAGSRYYYNMYLLLLPPSSQLPMVFRHCCFFINRKTLPIVSKFM